ncbi:arginine--tRNA ligase [Candidatus Woesearchaeota archaeon]|nr:arginine--tRNA ligase [Candidatus Woesearchaeota archaeon]HIH25491.1 arginine--tRNA ligase [Nanoarchaeota archaeon]
MDFKEELISSIKKQLNEPFTLEIPPSLEMGNFSLPCFKLSKKAPELQKLLKLPSFIEKTEIKGQYLNFFINKDIFTTQTINHILKEKDKFGSNQSGKNKKALVEHTSINPNASPHLGRARNAIIGDSIVRLLRFEGYKVETHYYVNDIGKQIAMLVLAAGNKKPSFHDLLHLYIQFNEKLEKDPSLEKEVFTLLNKLESGDKKIVSSFRNIVSTCIKGQSKILNELDIKFDHFDFESDFLFNKSTDKILAELKKKGKLFTDEEKRECINLEGFNLAMENPYLPLTRNDNTSLYILRDIAYNIHKISRVKDRNIIILGEDQKLYFQQLKTILSILGYEAPEVIHYSFVLLPSGKMSTRKGEVVLLEDFMNELKEKSKEEILKRDKSSNPEKVAKIIGYGALKFTFLKVSSDKNITFDIEKSLTFEGDTGPYVQYSYARASSILNKSDIKFAKIKPFLSSNIEYQLVNKLSIFNYIIKTSIEQLHPHIITNYSLELAKLFNEFYHQCPVINESNKDIQAFRLALVQSTRQVLKNSLLLLGIECPEQM